jgi:hypothetical protein
VIFEQAPKMLRLRASIPDDASFDEAMSATGVGDD